MKKNAETTEDNRDSGVLSGPLSFLHSGNFYWSGAYLYNRGEYGYYWLSSSYSAVYANYLRFDSTNLNPQGIDPRGYGIAVRCVGKSFTTLINTSYSMKNDGQTTEDNRDSGLLSTPLSYLRSGNFYWLSAGLSSRGGGGYYWSLRSADTTNSNGLYLSNTYLAPQNGGYRGHGFAVRNLYKPLKPIYNTYV